MTQDTFVELHGATCLHCGHRTAATTCPRCQHDTTMGPPIEVGPQTVRIGYLGRGGTAAPALWLAAPAPTRSRATTGAPSAISTAASSAISAAASLAGATDATTPMTDPTLSATTAVVDGATSTGATVASADASTGASDDGADADVVTIAPVAATAPAGPTDLLVTADGRVVDTSGDAPTGFVPVAGLTDLRCDLAAALVACRSEALLGWGGSSIEPTLVTCRLGVEPAVDLPAARRTACELAISGTPAAIPLLPLSPGEIAWWSALANLRLGDRDAAVRHMGELPSNGYAVVSVVLRWASQRWVGDAASAARFLLGRRLHGSAAQRLAQVSVACGITPLARFLLEPDRDLPETLRRVDGASPSVARALALRGSVLDRPLDVGPNVSLSVLDDLIDLATPLDPSTMSDDQRRHVVARTRPEALSDDDVDHLGLSTERDRRRLAAGRFDEIDAAIADPHVRGIVQLVETGEVNADLRAVDPVRAEHLAAYLAAPTAATLTPELVADPSLWSLLAARLDAPLWSWKTDLDHATQRFVGWFSLRSTFDRLVAADWEAALEAGHHAHRLAAGDDQRRDALNLIAFAHWQRGDGEAARDTLLSAIGGADDVPLRVNLAIVASSLDPESAALELARLVRESSSPELRCAAAMRAVHLWSSDDLPWTVRRHRPVPPALVDALRELVVEPIDPGVLRAILGLQSNLDRDWLARPAHLSTSPHRQSLEAKVFQARAIGPREYVDALTFALRSSSPPAWVEAERDRAVEIAARHVFDDDGSSALFALFAVQRKMPVTTDQRALLAPLAVLAVSEQTEPGADPPPDSYSSLLTEADTYWLASRPTPHVQHVMDAAWERLATTHVRFLELVIDRMVRAVEDLDRRLRRDPRQRRNVTAMRAALEPILDDAIAADDVLSEFRPHVTGAPIAREIDELLRTVRDIRRASMRML